MHVVNSAGWYATKQRVIELRYFESLNEGILSHWTKIFWAIKQGILSH